MCNIATVVTDQAGEPRSWSSAAGASNTSPPPPPPPPTTASTNPGSLKQNLTHPLAVLYQEPLFEVFLDLPKAYDTLEGQMWCSYYVPSWRTSRWLLGRVSTTGSLSKQPAGWPKETFSHQLSSTLLFMLRSHIGDEEYAATSSLLSVSSINVLLRRRQNYEIT